MRLSAKERVIAICCADIHLSLKAPIWRSAEEDWLEAQRRPLQEIENLSTFYNCPILCAGDIFNRWFGALGKGTPELINWALKYLPPGICAIAGQHDLPLHNVKKIYKSAFGTLVKAQKIMYLSPRTRPRLVDGKMELYGFNYGTKIKANKDHFKGLNILIAHQYKWIKGHSYPGASRKQRLGNQKAVFKNGKWNGYNVVIYGDNHKGFLTKVGNTTVFNCGTIIRRRLDEKDYKPQIGLLLNTGEIKIHYLDISQDEHLRVKKGKLEEVGLDTTEFFEELEKLGDSTLDFEQVVEQYIQKHKVTKKVSRIILQAMEQKGV